jgi:hypothetical protein
MIIPGTGLGIRHLIPAYIFVLAVIFSIQYVVEMVLPIDRPQQWF